jgi:dienelactone hydrolase
MRLPAALILAVVVANTAAAQVAPGPAGPPEGQWRAQTIWIPMTDAAGAPHLLYARLCRPLGETPARMVVFAHGTPADPAASVRRGYGATGGAYAEVQGSCDHADFISPGLESARDIAATVDYAATLPFIRPQGMVLIGQSTGGWATIVYNSQPHPRVTALINMSGGRGGHHENRPNNNCSPDRLAEAAGQLGARAATPMLWIYTANDSFFSPTIAGAMYAAFTRAGGRAEYDAMPGFGSDGHDMLLLRGGSAIWGPLVERYLATRPAQ